MDPRLSRESSLEPVVVEPAVIIDDRGVPVVVLLLPPLVSESRDSSVLPVVVGEEAPATGDAWRKCAPVCLGAIGRAAPRSV